MPTIPLGDKFKVFSDRVVQALKDNPDRGIRFRILNPDEQKIVDEMNEATKRSRRIREQGYPLDGE